MGAHHISEAAGSYGPWQFRGVYNKIRVRFQETKTKRIQEYSHTYVGGVCPPSGVTYVGGVCPPSGVAIDRLAAKAGSIQPAERPHVLKKEKNCQMIFRFCRMIFLRNQTSRVLVKSQPTLNSGTARCWNG